MVGMAHGPPESLTSTSAVCALLLIMMGGEMGMVTESIP